MKKILLLSATCILLTLTSCWFVAGVVVGSIAKTQEYTPVQGDKIFQTAKNDSLQYFLIKKECPEDTLEITSLSLKYIEN